MAKIIGIGGVSRSGKSDLSKRVKSHLIKSKTLLLDQDEFVKEESAIPRIKDRTDWEHPESIDFKKIIETIEKLRNAYDFIVVEGLLAFHDQSLNRLYDFRVHMEISKETFLERRKKETRWGVEPDWYWEHVWESFVLYGQPPKEDTIVISGEVPVQEETFQKLVKNIIS